MAQERQYSFSDPTKTALGAKAAAWVSVATGFLFFVVLCVHYKLLFGVSLNDLALDDALLSAAKSSVARVIAFQRAQIGVMFLGFLAFLPWVYQTSENAHALGAKDLYLAPGLAAGSYFIPLFNLYAPRINMSETWKASVDAPRWREQSGTLLVPLWWALTIAMIVGGGYLRSSGISSFLEFQRHTLLLMAYALICILQGIIVVSIVTWITRAQVRQYATLQEATSA